MILFFGEKIYDSNNNVTYLNSFNLALPWYKMVTQFGVLNSRNIYAELRLSHLYVDKLNFRSEDI